MKTTASPDTEQIDLTNCDREPIHILGKVQSYGCLLALSQDWMITHASRNVADLLGFKAEDLIGVPLSDVLSAGVIHAIRTKMQVLAYEDSAARIFEFPFLDDERLFDISIHVAGHRFIVEIEPRGDDAPGQDDTTLVQQLIGRLRRHETVEDISREAARTLRALTGFDRVMVYRFDEDASGSVIAEARDEAIDSFLNLRFPASDIPKQARALYTRSLLRIIPDVDAPTFEIIPERGADGEPLDLSLAVTRAVSEIHLEYLRNMGVAASMSVSILKRGKLWGLFACHNRTPLSLSYEQRSAIELYAQLFNYELAQVEMNAELADLDAARTLHDKLVTAVTQKSDILEVFDTFSGEIAKVIPHDGIAIYSDGRYRAEGHAPTREEFLGLARFLNTAQNSTVFASDSIQARFPAADVFGDRAAGILALPVSRSPRDYIVLFRREVAQAVNWAGNPKKPVELGKNGARLTPRKSFETWQEVVKNTSAPWKPSEIRAAEALRITLLEVVLKMADEASAAQRRAQEQQELLIAELNHRVRNILNLIRGLVSQGKGDADTLDAYSDVLDARIHALARAHDQLTQKTWNWVSLRSLVANEVKAFLSDKRDRVHITGDEIELAPAAFTAMALVIHELVTNSAKYGALNDSTGHIDLSIQFDDGGAAHIAWREKNGPPVQPPRRRGFGTTIIERSVPYELKGKAETRYKVSGFEADFMIPSTFARPAEVVDTPADAPSDADGAVTLSGTALVVEDNMIISMDASDILTTLGADKTITAPNVQQALKALDAEQIAFALIDVNLGSEVSLPVATACHDRGIPAVIATGYGESGDHIAAYPPFPVLKKPYTSADIQRALAIVMARD